MTLLLTGIHGFVGSNLVFALKERHSIYGLDIVSPEKKGIIKTYSWDELALLPEVDTIIHLAGKAHDTKNKSKAQEYFNINTGLTQKMFDYFLQSKAKQFIFFSSVKAAADMVEDDYLTEDVIPKPVGPYGESKIAAEKYILNKERGIAGQACNDKRIYIFRPCMIHGPGNKGNLNLLYNVVAKGFPWPLGRFDNVRSYTTIENLCWIVEQFILRNPESGIYNIADDTPLSTNKLIELIAASKGKKVKVWHVNKSIVKALAKIGDYTGFPLNSDRLQKLTENYIVSNQKLKNALGITSLPVESIEGMKKTLTYFSTPTHYQR